MIIIDTKILSEPLKPYPDEEVIQWLQKYSSELTVTSITVGEMFRGAQILLDAKRKFRLITAIENALDNFTNPILVYNEEAAKQYASLQAQARSLGKVLSAEDGMIAAIAKINKLPLATLNFKDFEGLGLDLIDPFLS